jgi:threonine/homoserine/homoserine lactone efflux protein
MMCAGLVGQFVTGTQPLREALICAAAAGIVGFTSSTGWAAFGALIARWLSTPARLRAFNGLMGATIALGVVWLIAADL